MWRARGLGVRGQTCIENGIREPAKKNRELCRFNFELESYWQGTYYAVKQVAPVIKEMKSKFTAIVRQEEGNHVALTPELDIASQGTTREEAVANLREAIELFLETAPREELEGRLSSDTWITQFEIEDAKT